MGGGSERRGGSLRIELAFSSAVLFPAFLATEIVLPKKSPPLPEATAMIPDETKIWSLEPGPTSSFGAAMTILDR